MHITSKSRYALKILLDLAEHYDQGQQRRSSIAERQSVPLDFMDQILIRLRQAGFVTSKRGPRGGVALGKDPQTISLWDIFSQVEDGLYPVACMEKHDCLLDNKCISQDAWTQVFDIIKKELSKKTLADLVTSWKEKRIEGLEHPLKMFECKGSKVRRL